MHNWWSLIDTRSSWMLLHKLSIVCHKLMEHKEQSKALLAEVSAVEMLLCRVYSIFAQNSLLRSLLREITTKAETLQTVLSGWRAKRSGRAWGSAMKKACQHYLFYWFNSKGLPLRLYVALAGPIENTTAANKKTFPKKLEHFYFYLLPTSTGCAWIIVKASHMSSSLWVARKFGQC